ncbi:hypothetical protein [Roseateles sp.]|uniref:hypothetical protein n=1 Tax=Roseateles sp. TaxID=1971397 RepID=UPI0031D5FFB5
MSAITIQAHDAAIQPDGSREIKIVADMDFGQVGELISELEASFNLEELLAKHAADTFAEIRRKAVEESEA